MDEVLLLMMILQQNHILKQASIKFRKYQNGIKDLQRLLKII